MVLSQQCDGERSCARMGKNVRKKVIFSAIFGKKPKKNGIFVRKHEQ